MQRFACLALFFTLIACSPDRADKVASAAAASFTRQHTAHKLDASVAGNDCRVLLITSEVALDDEHVESIHYGTGRYGALGGVEQLAHDRGFRAVVYRDRNGGLWTYGATALDEARALRRCR